MVGPYSGEGSESPGSLDVTNKTDDLEGRGLDDGDCLDFFLFVEFGLGSVDISEDVGHACLEASEGGEVGSLCPVVSGERSYSSSVVGGSLSGKETEVTLSGTTVFSV